MLFLGCVFILLALLSDSMYALLAGTVGHRLKAVPSVRRAERYVVGSVYIGLGVSAACAGARKP
jgi:threonine/homoserine/homoserine lactone efflux protein